ncbi:hypothetical protein ACWELJ_21395 [Nocardia sp. NPDC004582]
MNPTTLVLAKQLPATVTGEVRTLLEHGLWVVLMVCMTALLASAGGLMWSKATGRTLIFASASIVKALGAGVLASSSLLFATNFLFSVRS